MHGSVEVHGDNAIEHIRWDVVEELVLVISDLCKSSSMMAKVPRRTSANGATYPGAVDRVVDSPKRLLCLLDHGLHA